MEYKRFGNTVVVRMDKGEEIVEQVKQVALKENIKLAQVSALGATNDFEVGLFDTQKMQYLPNHFTGDHIFDRNDQYHERGVLLPFTYERCWKGWVRCRRAPEKSDDQCDLRNGHYPD